MKIRLRHYLYAALILLLFCLQSSAINKKDKDYGVTHKKVFNDPKNCENCHMINNFPSALDAAGEIPEEDIYDYGDGDNDDDDDGGVLGWFFGRKKKKGGTVFGKPIEEAIKSSMFISYKRSGFVNDERVMPHEFVKSISSICMDKGCHTDEELGNSHAVDVSPTDRFPDLKVPEEYPLYWDTVKYKAVMTCGTCHNPHLDWLNEERMLLTTKPKKIINGVKFYSTHFVRVMSPKKGLFTLCKGCHRDY